MDTCFSNVADRDKTVVTPSFRVLTLMNSGRIAAHNPASSNPYDKGTEGYDAWQKGYDEEKSMLDGINKMKDDFIAKAQQQRDDFNIEMRLLHVQICYCGRPSQHAIKRKSPVIQTATGDFWCTTHNCNAYECECAWK